MRRSRRCRPACAALSAVALLARFSPCADSQLPGAFVPTAAAGGGPIISRVRRRAAQGFLDGGGQASKRQPTKRVKTSAGMLTLGAPLVKKPDAGLDFGVPEATRWASAGRALAAGGGVLAGLVALLYITSIFELLMHSTSGLLAGGSTWVAAAAGLAVGALHTVSGPDHLAALAPMVVGQGHSTAMAFGLGTLWGSGHATGQLLIGLACLAVHAGLLRLHWASTLGQASGFLVGASLMAIGLLGCLEARGYQEEVGGAPEAAAAAKKRRFGWATYGTGVLHGLSPDALVFIAPALALPRLGAAFHVAGVVAGTLVSMGCCTAALSALCRRSPRLKTISYGASSVAMLLGACILAASCGISVPLPGL